MPLSTCGVPQSTLGSHPQRPLPVQDTRPVLSVSLDMHNCLERVFILGPAHHVDLRHCALSSCTDYETPLGTLPLDTEVIASLESTGAFARMDLQTDEDEHSIELQLPFIRYLLTDRWSPAAKIVPILVGAITADQEMQYGQLLAPYLGDTRNRFIVSSDFCHWGQRFSYTYYAEAGRKGRRLSKEEGPLESEPIYKSIERCDREGIEKIEQGSHRGFLEYLSRTRNTICGRVMLCALEKAKIHERFRFIAYTQSSRCRTVKDSSVSYAAGVVTEFRMPCDRAVLIKEISTDGCVDGQF
ncbi:hypothetical protein PMAC_002498 [Pneumocystis sp. 'macacae']|nr:hypothetical protein PMAC_002498 [Pneumocystis sp. 'macacae']